MRGSIRLTHATYLGYHGDAKKWLSDHPALARELANTLGYWYFLASITLPRKFVAGQENSLHMAWENKGTAPAYQHFELRAKLSGNARVVKVSVKEANNLSWMPGSECNEHYSIDIPRGTLQGRYTIAIALVDTRFSPERMIEIGLADTIRDTEGYYRLGEVDVVSR